MMSFDRLSAVLLIVCSSGELPKVNTVVESAAGVTEVKVKGTLCHVLVLKVIKHLSHGSFPENRTTMENSKSLLQLYLSLCNIPCHDRYFESVTSN